MVNSEYVRLTDAAKQYGVSRNKLWALAKAGSLTVYEDPKDRRVTLFKRSELDQQLQIREKERAAPKRSKDRSA